MKTDYEQLTDGAGLVDLAGRTLVEITGADRAALLHNMCTADVRKLQPGQGCEAFFTDASAKILLHAHLFAEPERIVLETVPGEAERIIGHLDRYIFREDAQLADRGSRWSQWLLAGAKATELLTSLTKRALPSGVLDHGEYTVAETPVVIRRVDWTLAGGYLLQTASAASASLRDALTNAGAVICSPETLEIARVEAGTPRSGVDITTENLPQEVDRDARAISFTKGCYIGQETVARIDALGHVNKVLRLVKFAGREVPSTGVPLMAEGKPLGKVTSAVFSPRWNAPLALAYVRRGHDAPGSQLESSCGPAEVVAIC